MPYALTDLIDLGIWTDTWSIKYQDISSSRYTLWEYCWYSVTLAWPNFQVLLLLTRLYTVTSYSFMCPRFPILCRTCEHVAPARGPYSYSVHCGYTRLWKSVCIRRQPFTNRYSTGKGQMVVQCQNSHRNHHQHQGANSDPRPAPATMRPQWLRNAAPQWSKQKIWSHSPVLLHDVWRQPPHPKRSKPRGHVSRVGWIPIQRPPRQHREQCGICRICQRPAHERPDR